MGLHSLRGYFRQLPAMNLEQMARQCLRPCTDPNTKQRVRLTYTRRVHELAPWVPDWCPPIPVRYAWRRIDARTLFSMAWQKGDREAAFYYGLLFAHGMGVPSDLPCARAMIEQARRNGSALANDLLHSWQHDQNRMQELSDSR